MKQRNLFLSIITCLLVAVVASYAFAVPFRQDDRTRRAQRQQGVQRNGANQRQGEAQRQGGAQKNTAFAIWIASAYLNPLSTVGPGCYILWQNIINSVEIWQSRKQGNEYAS